MSKILGKVCAWGARAWNIFQCRVEKRREQRRLRLCDTVSLGERRFVGLLEVDGRQFLIGGGSANIALLAELNTEPVKRNCSAIAVQKGGMA